MPANGVNQMTGKDIGEESQQMTQMIQTDQPIAHNAPQEQIVT